MELFNISFISYMNRSWIKCLLQTPTKFRNFPKNLIWGFSSPLRAPCGVPLTELDFDNKISTGPISEQKEKWTIKSIFGFWIVVVLTTAVVGVKAVQSVLETLPNIELKSTTIQFRWDLANPGLSPLIPGPSWVFPAHWFLSWPPKTANIECWG